MTGAALGVFGVVLALVVPAVVEWSRRPRLRIEKGLDANSEIPLWRIVHIRVVNQPLRGLLGRFLLRNAAAGCRVRMDFVSRSDHSGVTARGKWSAQLEPFAVVPVGPGTFSQVPDPGKIPQTLTLDVSPSAEGEPVAVAIKHNNDVQAYAYDPLIYVHGNLRNDGFALPDEAYEVTVTATAGEIRSDPRRFLLHNAGTAWRDIRLEPIE